MSLLTDQEIHAADPAPHERFDQERIDFARAIEQAVIRKLATVGVEPIGHLDGTDCLADFMSAELRALHDAGSSHTPKSYTVPVYSLQALAAARAQALEEFKADLADALCADCENGVKSLNVKALEKFRNDYPTLSALIVGKDV